ncbi:MAG: (d)CMP kinase [Gammaproteobacteria bacterium]
MADVPVIAVDGPGGTGKGTLCCYLAQWLGWHLLDSGALYRAVALLATRARSNLDSGADLAALARHTRIDFRLPADSGAVRVVLEGEDVTDLIRSEECGNAASRVAAHTEVRAGLLALQRVHRRPPGLVADGRDMGTVVFPDAGLKVYLTADPEERVKRRYKQLIEKGISVSLSRLSANIVERDHRDQERDVSPLRPARDAVMIDTTTTGLDEVRLRVAELVRTRFASVVPLSAH